MMNKVKQITLNILIVFIFMAILIPICAIMILLNWVFDKLEYYTRKGLNKLQYNVRIWLGNKIDWQI